MTPIDHAFARTRHGDPNGFTDWVRAVELSLRGSLRRFARHVDVESILQEGLLRMWRLAPTIDLEGKDASLRYALRLIRNLALREIERNRIYVPEDPAGNDPEVQPEPPLDPGLLRILKDCFARLPRKPREALLARIERGDAEPDRALAEGIGMRLNTFLQNIVRARRHLARCLESHGVSSREYAS
jgi:DNA-directed RNA polymerase specialized sigma24 family protein